MLSPVQDLDLRFGAEQPHHADAIEDLARESFGPGRFARAAERVREFAPPDPALSFVALLWGEVAGSVRQSRVLVGDRPAVMLGPLAVRPLFKSRGIGRTLMMMAAERARAEGESVVFLVGDRAYYEPLGYRPLPPGSLVMPGPVDPARILALPLAGGALEGFGGRVGPRRG